MARLEVMTRHSGCRAQEVNVDGHPGCVVIFALVDFTATKSPTDLGLSEPFVGLEDNRVKQRAVPSRTLQGLSTQGIVALGAP